ncbi:hypothetical protein D3C86_1809130 [compost metagenome]
MGDDLQFGEALKCGLTLARRVSPIGEEQGDLVGCCLDGSRVTQMAHGGAPVVLVRLP